LRLLLDELYAPAIAFALRARGHDVVSVHEAEPTLLAAQDEEVLAAGAAAARALVTENARDFRPLETALLAAGGYHHGIVYTSKRQFPRGDPATIGRFVRALDVLLHDPPDLRDRSIFLSRIED